MTYSLSRGWDVNTVFEGSGVSGLTIAAVENNPQLLEILLSHPDIKINNTARTILGNDETEETFIAHWTALMFACDRGNLDIVSRLVQVPGLDINYQDEGGCTAVIRVGLSV